MPHSYAIGSAKHGYATWLRHVRLCLLRQIRLRHMVTLHTELRHSAVLRHLASLLASLNYFLNYLLAYLPTYLLTYSLTFLLTH